MNLFFLKLETSPFSINEVISSETIDAFSFISLHILLSVFELLLKAIRILCSHSSRLMSLVVEESSELYWCPNPGLKYTSCFRSRYFTIVDLTFHYIIMYLRLFINWVTLSF